MAQLAKALAWSCVFLAAATVFAAEESYSETFQLNQGGTLDLKIDLGSIDIKTWDRNSIEFEAVVKGKSSFVNGFEFSFEDSPNFVQIRGEHPKRKWGFFSGSRKVKVTLRVPKESNVKIKTAGGNIKIQDLIGDAELRTSGGNLDIQNIDGELVAKTSGGHIRAGSIAGETYISTSGGYIDIDRVDGDLEARTSGGRISIERVRGEVVAKTSGGSIKLAVDGPFQGIDASTSGGAIVCYLADDASANISARTSGGSVIVDFPMTVQGKLSRSKVNGKINGGGPDLYLRTSGGSIKVLKAK